jgi:hypothetical protein
VTNLPPGVYVTASTSNPPRSSPTDTGVAFLLAVTSRAPALPTALTDLGDYNANLNGRQTYSTGYDWCDEAFHEGASRIIVSSVYGPAAAKASINIPGTSGTGIVLTAADLGDYANGAAGGLTAEVANGPTGSSTRVIIIRRTASRSSGRSSRRPTRRSSTSSRRSPTSPRRSAAAPASRR